MSYYDTFPNRTLCDVLNEMRKANETRNYSYLLGLIEECQYLGDKMEAALSDKEDVRRWSEERSTLRKEIKELRKEKKELGGADE